MDNRLMTAETKICQNCKKSFVIEPDDFGFYKKIGVPPPTFCPDCRYQRRLMFRNERSFYRRKCDLCKRDMIAVYPANSAFPVYCQKCWWSDNWNPLEYGRDVDFNRPFLEQIQELWEKIPALSIQNDDGIGSVNSEWAYDWAFSKNTYLSVCGWYTENCLYTYYACYDKDIMDCYFVWNSEMVYDLINCSRCSRSKHCMLCFDCVDCILSYDLRGCLNCTMCVGLRNKQFCILNQQYSKEEYFAKLKTLGLDSRDSLITRIRELEEFSCRMPKKFANLLKSTQCTGDNLIGSKNSRNSFYAKDLENCRHMIDVDEAKDCYDCNNSGRPELCYDCVTPDNSRGNKFSIFCWKCIEAEYSNNCHSSVSVLGCAALKHASYAILNKQYSKEEFIELRKKLIAHMTKTGEWGEFFSHTFSPFAYNESAAFDRFQLTKNNATAIGYRWKDELKKEYVPTKTAAQLPQTIAEVYDSVLNEIIECSHGGLCNEKCATAFRIVAAELALYRRMSIPLPTLCPNCRHHARIVRRNPPKLWHRRCDCSGARIDADKNADQRGLKYINTVEHFHGTNPCTNEFETSYDPDRKKIIYCEKCYNAEIM